MSRSKNLDNLIVCCEDIGGTPEMYTQMPLRNYIDIWMDNFKRESVKPSTYMRLKECAKALKRFPISNKKLKDITAFDIQNYVNQLTSVGYSLTTIKKQYRIVSAPLRQAAALHYIQADPTVGVRMPSYDRVKKPKKNISPYSEDEQRAIWDAIRGNDDWLIIGFLLETGIRAGEALALSWKNVDLANKRIRIEATVIDPCNGLKTVVQNSPKTFSSRRTVPLSLTAFRILEKLRNKNEEWVFTGRKNERLSYEALRYRTQQACRAAHVRYAGEHIFRHTFATNCYYKGVDVKVLSKILGHSDVTITYNIYISLQGDGFKEMYDAVSGTTSMI